MCEVYHIDKSRTSKIRSIQGLVKRLEPKLLELKKIKIGNIHKFNPLLFFSTIIIRLAKLTNIANAR